MIQWKSHIAYDTVEEVANIASDTVEVAAEPLRAFSSMAEHVINSLRATREHYEHQRFAKNLRRDLWKLGHSIHKPSG